MGEGSVFYWHLFSPVDIELMSHLWSNNQNQTNMFCNRFSLFVCLWFGRIDFGFWSLDFGVWMFETDAPDRKQEETKKDKEKSLSFESNRSWHAMRYHDRLWWHTIPDPRPQATFQREGLSWSQHSWRHPDGHHVSPTRQIKLGDPTLVALVVVGMLLSQKASVVKSFAVHATFS